MKKLLKGIFMLAVLAVIAYFGWNWWASKNENVPPVDELVNSFIHNQEETQESEGDFSLEDFLAQGDTEEGTSILDFLNKEEESGNDSAKNILDLIGEVDIQEVLGSITSGDTDALAGLADQLGDVSLEDLQKMGVYDINEQSMFDSSRETYTEEITKTDLGTDISDLQVNVGGSVLKLVESVDEHFYISGKDYGKLQYDVEGNKLILAAAKTSGDAQSIADGEILLYVPAGKVFSQVELELGAGMIIADKLAADTARLEVSMGALELNELRAGTADVNLSMGQIKMTADMSGDLEVKNSMGNLELNLKGRQADYDYKISGAMGKILLGDQEYSGAAAGEKLDNGSDKLVDLECSMGNITVSFTE